MQTLAVVEKGAFPRKALGDHDLEFPTDDPRWFLDGKATPITGDLRSGDFATSTEAYQRVLASLPRTIDVFHLEQPWLLPLVLKLKSEPRYAGARLVYGSQNIEAALREAIYRQMGFAGGAAVIERVLAVETSACRLADLTLAVSPSDHTTLEKIGARWVLRAPNGISTWQANPRLVDRWNAKINARRIALFVGSAHPPNIDGFIRAFGDSLGFVPPDCRIVIAGGVGPHLRNHYHRARFDTLNLSRLEVTGELDDDDLAAIKSLTSVFLLPIFEGGGSNIKTAEAIHSGKPVIATSVSLRGFEAYTHLPEISVADDKERFRLAVRKALSPQPPIPPQPGEGALRAKLLWHECLAVVPPAVQKLLTR
ncbi:MAG: glycosyltransferase [Archangium sp.]|nr:glycosyltransferase [Archangium sp.]MDP3151037.1 glycosyltransferase [Archangium sp.]MDP3569790.1 glycosyltransferase [Archangium sp.]